MNHTPTPWRAVDLRHQKAGQIRIEPNASDDAAFLIRSVNCHDELLAACKEALRLIRNQTGNWQLGTEDMLERAIAKAEAT